MLIATAFLGAQVMISFRCYKRSATGEARRSITRPIIPLAFHHFDPFSAANPRILANFSSNMLSIEILLILSLTVACLLLVSLLYKLPVWLKAINVAMAVMEMPIPSESLFLAKIHAHSLIGFFPLRNEDSLRNVCTQLC